MVWNRETQPSARPLELARRDFTFSGVDLTFRNQKPHSWVYRAILSDRTRGLISMGSFRTWSLALIAGIFVIIVAHQRSSAGAPGPPRRASDGSAQFLGAGRGERRCGGQHQRGAEGAENERSGRAWRA